MSLTINLLAAVSAAPFDAEAATRVYLATLQGAARAKSDAYFEGGYWLPLWGSLVAILAYGAMLRFGWSAGWSALAARITAGPARQAALYSLPFTLVGAALTLPWTIYSGFIRERKYGLVNQSFPAWFGEYAIQLAITLVITAIFFMIVFAVIRRAPRSWWAWASAATIALLALMIMVSPVFIAPLFNKYQPMAQGPLRDQILTMAHVQKIPADNVYVFDASKQSNRISANVSGLGPTIRISLNDNLLKRSTPAGIKAVMGHEMGHYVLNHIGQLIAFLSLITLGAFLLLWWATPRLLAVYGQRWGVTRVTDPAVAPVFAIIVTLCALAIGPLLNNIVRHTESQADAFGLEAAREPDGFAMTAMQLSEYRKIEPTGLEEILFFDHPSGRTRVKMAMEWKARHLAELPVDQRGQMVMTSPPAN
ncbi:MAG: M48 family metallopeptidase [Sphingomonas bacterium]|nr:M48 family metallopeptidase [Sphingomonas bacterium]